ncbi:hypothetical protein QR685DRAFT_118408 [Neurospora intermedia]|uniref:Uncharacterized protein n=1 Tax=Neurospora intermedia TaxID=5142 RepID=A0ABR3D060_NEUIN
MGETWKPSRPWHDVMHVHAFWQERPTLTAALAKESNRIWNVIVPFASSIKIARSFESMSRQDSRSYTHRSIRRAIKHSTKLEVVNATWICKLLLFLSLSQSVSVFLTHSFFFFFLFFSFFLTSSLLAAAPQLLSRIRALEPTGGQSIEKERNYHERALAGRVILGVNLTHHMRLSSNHCSLHRPLLQSWMEWVKEDTASLRRRTLVRVVGSVSLQMYLFPDPSRTSNK